MGAAIACGAGLRALGKAAAYANERAVWGVPIGTHQGVAHPLAEAKIELDTRYTLETDSGKIIYVQNAGVRHAAPEVMQRLLRGETVDPKLVYFRTIPTFETAAADLQWLTRAVFIGTGERYPTEVVIRFWRVE